jgi:hypothetical protein
MPPTRASSNYQDILNWDAGGSITHPDRAAELTAAATAARALHRITTGDAAVRVHARRARRRIVEAFAGFIASNWRSYLPGEQQRRRPRKPPETKPTLRVVKPAAPEGGA